MVDPFWSYILTGIGLAGFVLAGSKVWWSWYVNIANQALWFAYAYITEQWGFLVGTFIYTYVFVRNAYLWTKARRDEGQTESSDPIGLIEYVEFTPKGLQLRGTFSREGMLRLNWEGLKKTLGPQSSCSESIDYQGQEASCMLNEHEDGVHQALFDGADPHSTLQIVWGPAHVVVSSWEHTNDRST